MISSLSTREYNYIFNYNTSQELWDILEMIYEVPVITIYGSTFIP